MSRLAIAAAFGILSGCATAVIGRPIQHDAVEQIVPGYTEVERVIQLLGEPLRQVEAKGRIILIYRYALTDGFCEEIIVCAVQGKVISIGVKPQSN